MPAKSIIESFSPSFAEVSGSRAVEIATRLFHMVRRHLGHRRAQSLTIVMDLEDVNLPLFASALGDMCKPKLMCKGVNGAALKGRQVGGEGHAVSLDGLLENEQLRIK